MDGVKEDIRVVGVIEEDAEERGGWRPMVCCRKKKMKMMLRNLLGCFQY